MATFNQIIREVLYEELATNPLTPQEQAAGVKVVNGQKVDATGKPVPQGVGTAQQVGVQPAASLAPPVAKNPAGVSTAGPAGALNTPAPANTVKKDPISGTVQQNTAVNLQKNGNPSAVGAPNSVTPQGAKQVVSKTGGGTAANPDAPTDLQANANTATTKQVVATIKTEGGEHPKKARAKKTKEPKSGE